MIIRRLSSVVLLSVLSAACVGAGLAWACAPSNWGWSAPSAPQASAVSPRAAPPAEEPAVVAQSPAVQTPAQTPAPSSQSGTVESIASTPAQAQSPARTQPRQSERSSGDPSARRAPQAPASAPTPVAAPRSAVESGRAAAGSSDATAVAERSLTQRSSAGRAGDARADRSPRADRNPAPSAPERRPAGTRSADLWSDGAGSSDAEARPAAGPGNEIALGAGLLGLGAVALFGAFAVAGMRRSRVPARSEGPPASDR